MVPSCEYLETVLVNFARALFPYVLFQTCVLFRSHVCPVSDVCPCSDFDYIRMDMSEQHANLKDSPSQTVTCYLSAAIH